MSIFWQDNLNSNQQFNYNRQSNYNGGDNESVKRKFDKDKLNNYFNNADYYGAAYYLESITPKDVQSRVELNKRIRELRRMAEHQKGFLNNIRNEYGQDGIDAYNFLHRFRSGASMDINDSSMYADMQNNKFIKDYNTINELNIKDGNNTYIPDKIQIQIANDGITLLEEELLDSFNEQGFQSKTLKDFGILKTKDGLSVDIHSPYLNTVFNRLDDINEKFIKQHIQESDYSLLDGVLSLIGLGDPNGKTLAAGDVNSLSALNDSKAFKKQIESNNDNVYTINSTDTYYKLYLLNTSNNKTQDITNTEQHKKLLKAKNALGSAKFIEKEYNKSLSKKNIIEETYVSQFLGAGHVQAYNMLKNGKIDIDDYNKIVKERQETYDRLIQQTDLTQYKVYATDVASDNAFENAIDNKFGPGTYATMMDTKKRDETSMHELNNYDRRDLTKDLLVAIKDKRVTYSAAMVGGEMGTYITITPNIDETTGEPKEGSSAKYRRIFIPHLFESSCEEALNADTRSMAVRDLSDIGRYNYAKTLSDGKMLEYNENGNLVLSDFFSNTNNHETQRIISKDEALLLLDRDNAIDQSIDAILAQLGDSYNKKDADTLAQYAAEAIVNNLYKNINRGDKELETNRVYISILKGLKIK